ncbi:MAG: YihA family ribosome biogenesis GTP-binding protein [Syntrophobacteraceae bacterium CG23_combo_of_CG06-09_8_20_14_all_50_8]|nr:MAG: YihA family ribosome biogenesis GTP-binding protein [Syntrophobacteraceae bacterium CG23_combo_of_CG06-09_8_20_14_all_50_8]
MKILAAAFVKSAVLPSQYPSGFLPEIAFAGRSNVGKSSLINTLTQRRGLARTSNAPGCTQLINFFTVNDRLSLVDLPGYGFARVPEAVKKNWGPMVETYLKERQALRLVVLVLDVRRNPGEHDLSLFKWFESYRIPCLVALTKTDKLSKQQVMNRRRVIMNHLTEQAASAICFSARTGAGKEELWQEIEKYIF